jgi:hypothetical protein
MADQKGGQQKLQADCESADRGAGNAPRRNKPRRAAAAPNHVDPGEPRKPGIRETTIYQ